MSIPARTQQAFFDSLRDQLQQQLVQGNQLFGIFKGVVEDNADPFGLGRCKIRVYGVHGNPEQIFTEDLPWAEAIVPYRDGFDPPEVEDRVAVVFEAGDRYKPMYIGYWYAIPAGRGISIPHNARQGTEVPIEGWEHSRAKPQAMVLGKTAEGSGIWMEESTIGQTHESRIVTQDSGGQSIQTESTHVDGSDYQPEEIDPITKHNSTRYRKKPWQHDRLYKDIPGQISLSTGAMRYRQVKTVDGQKIQEELQEGDRSRFEAHKIEGEVHVQRMTKILNDENREPISVSTHLRKNIGVQSVGHVMNLANELLTLPKAWI